MLERAISVALSVCMTSILRMRTISKNHPIATVIKNYENKKSGKVTESRQEIQRRFFGLDWKDQKKIMRAFLKAGKADRDWAYSRLLDLWDDDFTIHILAFWLAYHEEKCGWVIIRHFPKDFLKNHIDEFKGERDYYFVCRRLVEESDFLIDKKRLSNIDYLMVLYHAHRHIDDEEAQDLLFRIVHEAGVHQYPYLEISRNYIPRRSQIMRASAFQNVSMALYYLEKMSKDEVVCSFHIWESEVQTIISASKEYDEIKGLPLSDYEYSRRMADIVQKYMFEALPRKYKKGMK